MRLETFWAIAPFCTRFIERNILAPFTIPNRQYAKDSGVNGHMGLARRECLSDVRLGGLERLSTIRIRPPWF
jgi:hypothetical protein